MSIRSRTTPVEGVSLQTYSQEDVEQTFRKPYNRTPIICTLGRAYNDTELLRQLTLGGMDVARLNLSFDTYESFAELIKNLRTTWASMDDEQPFHYPRGIALELGAPEARIGNIQNHFVELEDGQEIKLTTNDHYKDIGDNQVGYIDKMILSFADSGDKILLGKGRIWLTIKEVSDDTLVCIVKGGGPLRSKDFVYMRNPRFHSREELSNSDKMDIKFAVDQDVDFLFVMTQSPRFLIAIRKHLREVGGEWTRYIRIFVSFYADSLIEEETLNQLLEIADGVGYMKNNFSMEVPFELTFILERKLMVKSRRANNVCVAFVDMAATIKDSRKVPMQWINVGYSLLIGSSALMLEILFAKDPVEAVESVRIYTDFIDYMHKNNVLRYPASLRETIHPEVQPVETLRRSVSAMAIIVLCADGRALKLIATSMLNIQVFALFKNERLARKALLLQNVAILLYRTRDPDPKNDSIKNYAIRTIRRLGYLEENDPIVIVEECGGFQGRTIKHFYVSYVCLEDENELKSTL